MCCAGQPVILVGDFNADPTVIPSLAKGILDGHWIDIEVAFTTRRGVAPSRTCQFQLDEDKGSRGDFVLACPIAMAATTACRVLPDRWFVPHFAVYAEFSLSAWDATVDRAMVYSKKSALYLGRLGSNSLLSVTPLMWMHHGFCGAVKLRRASLVLISPLVAPPTPPLSDPGSYVGRGQLSICTMRLGGRCGDRIHRVDRADEFDVTHSGFFINSSLAPVLRFRRRFVSVCNVLKGIKLHGFLETRVVALWCRWRAVVRMGLTGPVTSFEPWTHWIPPDLHGFYKWAMDTFALLNEFVLKVVSVASLVQLDSGRSYLPSVSVASP